jgi:uncharacterized protein (DUF2062 family)
MTTEPAFLERLLTGSVLASLAVAVAFGPELRRIFLRLRSRRLPDVADAGSVGVEAQQQ